MISGGGTGGHIYPAIAIAKAFEEAFPNAEILFVGAKGRMEMQKVPEVGYQIEGLNISGIQRKLSLKNLSFPFKLIGSLIKAEHLISKFKPDVVVGVGGYASGPLLYRASRRKIPTLIQEQNSYAGLTNKLLAPKVNKICVAYENMDQFFPEEKLVLTGNPVRIDILKVSSLRNESIRHFNLDPQKQTVLVVGGSLGARTLNESIFRHLDAIQQNNIQLLWQIGKIYINEFTERLTGKSLPNIRTFEFLKEMDLAYAAADVVISRAGALSISEISLAGKAAIFVPSPNVAEDHQTKNAAALVKNNAAKMITDKQARKELVPFCIDLLKDEKTREEMQQNIKKMAKEHATDNILQEIKKLLN